MKSKNKIIAEFMGRRGKVNSDLYWVNIPDTTWITIEEMKFNSSWDWLMPVLKKINLKLTPQNYSEWRMINSPTEYEIAEVFNQAVQFIEWYNS